MSDYQERYDEHLATALSAVANLMPDLEDALPGLNFTKVRRILTSISTLLARLDKTGAKFPEYLSWEGTSLPDHAITSIQGVPKLAANGAAYFANYALVGFVDIEQRLIRALGIGAYTLQDIKSQQVLELQAILQSSQDALAKIQSARREIADQQKSLGTAVNHLAEQEVKAVESLSAIEKVRQTASKLAAGDARGGSSLERIIRAARTKNEELEAQMAAARGAHDDIVKLRDDLQATADKTRQSLQAIEGTGKRADDILRGATQAGLAGAYKMERDRLSKEQMIYAAVFYGIILSVIVYAAVFIVPLFNKIVSLDSSSTTTTVGEMALLLGVRVAILLPAIWALIFTSRRHAKIETLQMDYAAKANTALAYSGYREEMESDPDLTSKLKDGLLVRFLEHPERLLSKNSVSESVDVGPEGVRYSSQSEPVPSARAEQDEGS
jgi:predicted  nucleic acid-binding Zn-ribbon protein